ncbi:tripartite tricarboxylate transporter TctB family protein [Natronohydrobacter thiooxidans]|uniref:tripartite tricarboxylate transporter TctB family protein n=1 Tax=Natronohydrobacter thiooxidans TaxID=87172 RepID=UPI000A5C2785|nr:tripartite tricarboxylate transporter TctB family protein [Natronohydrobacter thiooxidans]
MSGNRLRPWKAEPLTVVGMAIGSGVTIALALDIESRGGVLPLVLGLLMALCTLLYGTIGRTREEPVPLVLPKFELIFAVLIGAMLLAFPLTGFWGAAWAFSAATHAVTTFQAASGHWLRRAANSCVFASAVVLIAYVVFAQMLRINLP